MTKSYLQRAANSTDAGQKKCIKLLGAFISAVVRVLTKHCAVAIKGRSVALLLEIFFGLFNYVELLSF